MAKNVNMLSTTNHLIIGTHILRIDDKRFDFRLRFCPSFLTPASTTAKTEKTARVVTTSMFTSLKNLEKKYFAKDQ